MTAEIIELSPEVLKATQKKIDQAKLNLMIKPDTVFYSTLLAQLKLQISEVVPTAGTNGIDLYMNPHFVESLSLDETIGLLLHEVKHVVYEHPVRAHEMDLNDKLWNVAGDFYINLEIVAEGYKLPPNPLLDDQYRGMSTLQIYKTLDPEDYPDFEPDVIPAPADMSEEEFKERVVGNILKAATQAKLSNQYGNIPANILRKLEELTNPVLPWNTILQNHMAAYSRDDYSWRKPNRRFMPDFYLPSMYSESLDQITVAVDTSGSIGQDDMQAFISEINYIWGMMKPKKLRLLSFDTAIHDDDLLYEGDVLEDVELHGGGGTDVQLIMDTLSADNPEVAIVFTDGYFPLPNVDDVRTDIFWVIKNNSGHDWQCPLGTTIYYTD
jgi:predicted metal-dependent peptidase